MTEDAAGVGMAAGPILGGFLSELVGYQGTALAAGVIMSIPALVNWQLLPSKRTVAVGGGGGGGFNVS